jgi:predicted DNA-binding transcriptional regulator
MTTEPRGYSPSAAPTIDEERFVCQASAVVGSWTFLTNHAHVLLTLAREPDLRLRDVAERVGITERAAQAIVSDLVAAGYLRRQRVGRRNVYSIDGTRPLRHPLERDHGIHELLDTLR